MDQQLKQRLVGAAVLVTLAVIFIPMILDDSGEQGERMRQEVIPPKPTEGFNSRIVPLDEKLLPAEVPAGGAVTEAAPDTTFAPAPADASKPPAGETPAPPVEGDDVREGVKAWAVQVGSFSSADNARTLEARLKEKGYSAFVDEMKGSDKPIYRVRVGPELLHAKAEEIKAELQEQVGLEGIVVRYP